MIQRIDRKWNTYKSREENKFRVRNVCRAGSTVFICAPNSLPNSDLPKWSGVRSRRSCAILPSGWASQSISSTARLAPDATARCIGNQPDDSAHCRVSGAVSMRSATISTGGLGSLHSKCRGVILNIPKCVAAARLRAGSAGGGGAAAVGDDGMLAGLLLLERSHSRTASYILSSRSALRISSNRVMGLASCSASPCC